MIIMGFIRRHRNRFLKFCFVGLSGVAVNEGLLWLFTDVIGIFFLLSSLIAIEISILTNFSFNEIWTFRDMRGGRKVYTRMAMYNLVAAGGMIINLLILYVLVNTGMYYLVANLFGIAGAVLWNYFVNYKWTWLGKNQSL
jgi:dolichol-phosphate mannosyltransferase